MHLLKRISLTLLRRSPVGRYLTHRYDYSFSPSQLAFLLSCLDSTREVPGSVLEVGCAYGHTTVFLKKHLEDRKIIKDYVCIDTFSGFTADDIRHEHVARGKTDPYVGRYADASLDSFRRTMQANRVAVRIVKGDVCHMDLAAFSPISFALLDVDLYRPVSHGLRELYGALAPGGRIVVDDCQEHPLWDGALEAYEEFVEAHDLPKRIECRQFGIVDRQ